MNKSTFLLLALSISVSYVVTSPSLGLFANAGLGLGGAAQALVSGAADVVANVAAAGFEGAAGLVSSLQNVTTLVSELAINLSLALHAAVDKIVTDFLNNIELAIEKLQIGIQNNKSDENKQVLSKALDNLNIINSAAQVLKDHLASAFKQLENIKTKYLAEINEKIRDWTQLQLDRVNRATNGRGNNAAIALIDQLLSRYEKNIHGCIDNFVGRQAWFEKSVERTLSSLNNATIDLLEAIDTCLDSNKSSTQCRNAITSALTKLKEAEQQILDLKQEGLQVLALGVQSSALVGATIEAFESEKYSVILQLNIIIANFK